MRALVLLWMVLGAAALGGADNLTAWSLAHAVGWRDLDALGAFREKVTDGTLGPLGADQALDPDRVILDQALAEAPAAYLRACLALGYDPRVLTVEGRDWAPAWEVVTDVARTSLVFRLIEAGRGDSLALIDPATCDPNQVRVVGRFSGRTLRHLDLETLAEAAARKGDADSLAWAARLGPTRQRPSHGPGAFVEALLDGRVGAQAVVLRQDPSSTSPETATLAPRTAVRLDRVGPPLFIDRQPRLDRWFRVTAGAQAGWVWGPGLDLAFDHGETLKGRALVDFLLWNQGLYQDVRNRAQDLGTWSDWRLLRFAVEVRDPAFVKFLAAGEDTQGVLAWLADEGDQEGVALAVDQGVAMDPDLVTDHPDRFYLDLGRRSGLDFGRVWAGWGRWSDSNYEGLSGVSGSLWADLLGRLPVPFLLDLLPQVADVNRVVGTWTWSSVTRALLAVETRSLLDLAMDRGDPRLVKALEARGAQSAAALGPPPEAWGRFLVNSDRVRLRKAPGPQAPVLRLLAPGDPVVLRALARDADPPPGLEDDPHHWAQVITARGEAGWVWDAYLDPPGSR